MRQLSWSDWLGLTIQIFLIPIAIGESLMRDFIGDSIIGLGLFTLVMLFYVSLSQGFAGLVAMLVLIFLCGLIVSAIKKLFNLTARILDR